MGGIEVGDRLIIKGDWDTTQVEEGKIVIRMPVPPIRSYGAGWNSTTRKCLEELERLVTPEITVLDLGTSTGILATAAVKLGASKVYATEMTDYMYEFATRMFQINNVEIVFSKDHNSFPYVDLCVANIGDDFWDIYTTIKATKSFMIGNKSGEIEYAST